jgi:hypothetical protein
MNKVMQRLAPAFALASCLAASGANAAETIFLGIDTQGPVQQYTTAGALLGPFGQTAATGSALDGAGSVWTARPAFGANTIKKYDAVQTELNSFTVAIGGQWIEDMAYGGKVSGVDTLWLGTYEGTIWRINANTGEVVSSFDAGVGTFVGVAYDGTDLWLTGGAFSGNTKISRFSESGSFLGSIETGNTGAGGIGYSASTNTLWVGYWGEVRQYDMAGTQLSSFSSSSGYYFHDGLEIGEVSAVPEPGTVVMMGLGLGGLAWATRRKKA